MGATERVELVEGDDDPEPTPTAPRHRRGLRLLAVAVVVLVGALAAGQAVLDTRERAHVAALRQVPGVLEPLDDPHLLWSTTWRDPVTSGTRVADLVVSGVVDEDGVVTLTGTALRTGAARWTVRVTLPVEHRAALRRADDERALQCQPLGAPRALPTSAACLVGARRWLSSPRQPARLVVVDAAGTVVSERTVEADAWATRADHLVLATVEGDDVQTWTVSEQTATGATAWSRTLEPKPAPEETVIGPVGPAQIMSAQRCTMIAAGRWAVVLGPDGTVLTDVVTDADELVSAEPPCTLVRQRYVPDERARLVLPGGLELPESVAPSYLSLDDGGAEDLLLVSERGVLAAREPTTGAAAWTSKLSASGGMRLDGRVYSTQDRDAVVLDARTGRELWRTRLDLVPRGLLTDGAHLVALGADGRLALVDLAGGGHRRTLDLRDLLPADAAPDGEGELVVYPWNGLLVAVSQPRDGQDQRDGRVWVIG